ncbi:MAG: hypothetical protein IIZ67_06055 [Bacilli bacterium]|nr:hypothetical protein [Bacilli bacterium]
MIKKCPKCYRELDTDKDFCVLCGESYKNEELDKKIDKKIEKEEKIKEENKEEKEESSIVPIIVYGFATLIFGSLVFIINLSTSCFSVIDSTVPTKKPPLWIALEVLVVICFIGVIIAIANRKSNKK